MLSMRETVNAMMQRIVMRGTMREFENGRKLVWFGETMSPEEIEYHEATLVNDSVTISITDAATGQSLSWDDLQDGDYVAVEMNGVIEEAGKRIVYGITRLSRASMDGTVSAIENGNVTITAPDGVVRTVTVDGYYIRGVRLDVDSLQIGDVVRLDFNALDTEEIYALHLVDRTPTVLEVMLTETYRVTRTAGALITVEGDIAFDTENKIFYDVDGSVRSVHGIRSGDLLRITHDGQIDGGDPYLFGEIYRIERVTE